MLILVLHREEKNTVAKLVGINDELNKQVKRQIKRLVELRAETDQNKATVDKVLREVFGNQVPEEDARNGEGDGDGDGDGEEKVARRSRKKMKKPKKKTSKNKKPKCPDTDIVARST